MVRTNPWLGLEITMRPVHRKPHWLVHPLPFARLKAPTLKCGDRRLVEQRIAGTLHHPHLCYGTVRPKLKAKPATTLAMRAPRFIRIIAPLMLDDIVMPWAWLLFRCAKYVTITSHRARLICETRERNKCAEDHSNQKRATHRPNKDYAEFWRLIPLEVRLLHNLHRQFERTDGAAA